MIQVLDVDLDIESGDISFGNHKVAVNKTILKFKEEGKRKYLYIDYQGETYMLESAERSFFKGQGKIADKIDDIQKNLPQALENARTNEQREILYNALKSGNIPHIDPPFGILLKKGEFAVMCDDTARYCKEKTKTEYYGGGGSVRISKNITLRGGKGVPVTREYIATLDMGRLVLTNKKIIFTGQSKSTTIPLSKIADITPYKDAISLVKEGVQTRPIFADIDGIAWTLAIQMLNQSE